MSPRAQSDNVRKFILTDYYEQFRASAEQFLCKKELTAARAKYNISIFNTELMVDGVIALILFGFMTMFFLRWLTLGGRASLNRDAIRNLFRQQLLATCEGARILDEGEDGLTLQLGEEQCVVRLEQLFRRCGETPARTGHFIRQAAAAIGRAFADAETLGPDWRRWVAPQLLRLDQPFPQDALVHPVVGQLGVGYVIEEADAFRWVTRSALDAAGIDANELHQLAMTNLERSCNMLEIEAVGTGRDERDRLLRFHTFDGLDAARLLMPSFYRRYSPRFGDVDLLVMVPTRDSLVMVGAQDTAYMTWLARFGDGIQADRAYPLYSHPLKITAQGIEPVV